MNDITMTNQQKADKNRFINTLAEMVEKYAPKLEEQKNTEKVAYM